MEIKEFEKKVIELLTEVDEDGTSYIDDCMELSVHDDGCLRCTIDGYLVNTEGFPWSIALDIIIEALEKRKANVRS